MHADSIPVLDMSIAILIMVLAISQTPQPISTQGYQQISKAASWLELNTSEVRRLIATYENIRDINKHLTKLFEKSVGANKLKIVATRDPEIPLTRIVALRFYPEYGVWVIIYE